MALARAGEQADARPDRVDASVPLRPGRRTHRQRASPRVRRGARPRRVLAPDEHEHRLAVHSLRPRCRLPHVHRRSLAAGRDLRLSRQSWIRFPEGRVDDSTDADTASGLAKRKGEVLVRDLHQHGATALPGAHRYLDAAGRAGLTRAVVSASASTLSMLELAALDPLVEVYMDADVIRSENIRTPPSPEVLLAVCRRLDIRPQDAVTFTHSAAGVAAGLAAGMAVVGVGQGVDAGCSRFRRSADRPLVERAARPVANRLRRDRGPPLARVFRTSAASVPSQGRAHWSTYNARFCGCGMLSRRRGSGRVDTIHSPERTGRLTRLCGITLRLRGIPARRIQPSSLDHQVAHARPRSGSRQRRRSCSNRSTPRR